MQPAAVLAAALAVLIAFVEQERGLELRRPVDVRVLEDAAFLVALRQDAPTEPPAYDLGATYGALGVAEQDFGDEVEQALDETVVGYYDSVREELVVRARPVDAYLELVLVHELTHVVQDQWFETYRPTLFDLTERLLAFDAVVEGDATRVERAYYRSLSAEDRALVDEVQGQEAYAPVLGLGALASELDFAYAAGLRLVDALLAGGGQERLDAALRSPPTTTEQVLHPEALDDGPPLSPPAPRRPGKLVDEGVLGERGLALVLGRDPLEPDGPQVGCEGDTYATYEQGDELCTVAAVEMATAADRDELVEALLSVGVRAEARGGAGLELTSCA